MTHIKSGTSYTEALREARDVFEKRFGMSKEEKINAVISLAEWRCFSNNHLAAITGLQPYLVAGYTGKTDSTGGTFTPHAIPALLEVIALRTRSEKNVFAVADALDAGCGIRMMARLTGMPETTIARHAAKARRIRDARALADGVEVAA